VVLKKGTPDMMESEIATLEVLYETYAADARRDWEEKGRPGVHAFYAWENIRPFLEREKARLQNPDQANISDALSDACSEIEAILDEQPPRYTEKRERIEAVLSQMKALRAELDAWGE
jgi:hypothetical protein